MKKVLETWNRYVISESSLSRLYKHITEKDSAVITAFRDDPNSPTSCSSVPPEQDATEESPEKANKARNRELKAVLLRKGYGVTRVAGTYVENFDDVSNRKEVSEESFFVSNLKDDPSFVSEIAELGKIFCQDSVLIIPKGGQDAYLFGTNESWPGLGVKEEVGSFRPGKESEFMSRVGKRPFTFNEVGLQEAWNQLSRNAKWSVSTIAEKALKKR